MAHLHSVYDSDPHFSIDAKSRVVTNLSADKWTLMQYDHNSERITFELPRYIDGHDMTVCNQVQVHYINIGENGERNTGIYEVTDLDASPAGQEVAICSWLISRNATSLVGSLSFIVRFSCVSDGSVDYSWNTAIYNDISISNGINNTEVIVEEYADVLMQWSLELERMGMVIDGLAESTVTQEDISNAIKQNRVFWGEDSNQASYGYIDVYLDTDSRSRWTEFKHGDVLFCKVWSKPFESDPTLDIYMSTGWTGYMPTGTNYNPHSGSRNPIPVSAWRAGSVIAFVYDEDLGGFNTPFIQPASTSYYGLVKLNDTVTSTSKTEAATAAAVKKAYDKAVEAVNSSSASFLKVNIQGLDVGVYALSGMTWGELIDSPFVYGTVDANDEYNRLLWNSGGYVRVYDYAEMTTYPLVNVDDDDSEVLASHTIDFNVTYGFYM